jgi:hypothetical protein
MTPSMSFMTCGPFALLPCPLLCQRGFRPRAELGGWGLGPRSRSRRQTRCLWRKFCAGAHNGGQLKCTTALTTKRKPPLAGGGFGRIT